MQQKSSNPLKQYFRRPSLYFRLPSGGKLYEPGVVDIPPNGELAVYPMTSIDEMKMRIPDALFNGAAMVDLIKSCVPDIKDPWRINNIDFDSIVVAIRAATVGNSIDIESTCPKCEKTHPYEINLVQLLTKQQDVDYDKLFTVRELEFKFKPLTYVEINRNNLAQFEIQRAISELSNYENTPENQKQVELAIKKMNDLVTGIIVSTIEFIKTPDTMVSDKSYILEFMSSCDKKTYDEIKDESIRLRETNDLKPSMIKCVECAHPYEQRIVLNATDFFV